MGARITVAICTRNRATFLDKAVRSVLPQLGPHDELLIIDNASTDNTPKVGQSFAKADPRIRLYREETLGLSAGRNAAHRLATAEFVLFLDDDAVVRDGWLDAYVDFIAANRHRRIGAVGGACIPEYEVPPPAWHDPALDLYEPSDEAFQFGENERAPGGGNCAYNTAAVLAAGGFCQELRRAEDTDMHLKLIRAGCEIWFVPGAPIYHFMPARRMRFWPMAKAAFFEGRASARMRLRQHEGARSRELYRFGRILGAIPNAGFFFLGAAATFPIAHGRKATRKFQRGLRALGMGWQMLADFSSGDVSYLQPATVPARAEQVPIAQEASQS